jgi:membrane-bound serine protease (ClpP class)
VIRLPPWISLAALVLLLAPASSLANTVYVVTVEGIINPAVADYLEQSIQEAGAAGADALVIELDTPGGLVSSTEDIVKAILNAPLPVIVFVAPRGASATSAGVFITLAGHVAVMAPGTSIGAAHPVSVLPSPEPPPQPGKQGAEGDEPPRSRDIMGEKVENWAAAFIESIAEMRDRNVEWAADAVRESVAITQKEALEKNVVDLVAEDLDHLLEIVDGREVTVGREPITLQTANAQIVRPRMSLLNRFFDVISHPNITMILILAGLGGLYMEVSNPGLIVPGVLGVTSLVLAGLSLQIIPFNSLGLILILAGVGLMVAEIFVTSFGLLFAAGVACMGLGGYLLFDVPELAGIRVPFFSVILPMVLGFAALGAIIVFGVSRTFLRPQYSGLEGMVGEVALVDSDIDPSGRVFVHGEFWNAESDEPIRKGERVEVLQVRDLVLRVGRLSQQGEGT